MTDSMQTTILFGLIAGFLTILLTIVGFGFKHWLEAQAKQEELRARKADERDKELRGTIDGLKEAILRLSEKFVLKSDYDRDMAILRVTGRRAADACNREDCPLVEASRRPGISTQG